ncbi:hypothetical protein N0V85_003702, partial [Neurospora sp. IMI 360204]
GLSQSQQQQPSLRRRLSLADELAMAGNSDTDSSNYGDEVDYDQDNDYQQEDGDKGDGGEEEDEEFGEFGEVGEASVIQSELGSGSDRDLLSPRTPEAGGGPGYLHGGGGGFADHSRTSSINSIPMSEGLVGQIPPSEYGSQFDEGSTYGGRGYGGYGAHSRQISNVSIDDRISYFPSTWGNVSSVEEGQEEEEEEQQDAQEEEEQEEEEELRGPGGRPLSGYFPGAGRYDGEYDDDREYGDEDDEEEGDGYADGDGGMEEGDDGSEGTVDENEELTEIIEQLRPYMRLSVSGAASNTGRISA